MKTLEDIFWNRTAEREILFEDGKWCIYRKVHDPSRAYMRIYLLHRCSNAANALNNNEWICGNNQKHGCGEVAPEGIQALYILHEWDNKC